METKESKNIDPKRIKDLQKSFDTSMKILESHIAESITNKEKLETLKNDLKEANKKFIEAETFMDELKKDIDKSIIK